MAVLGIVHPPKQPSETFVVAIDFAMELGPGETIASRVVTSKRVSDGLDTGAQFLSGTPGGDLTVCAIRIVGGIHGETHRVQMRIGTTLGNSFEHELDCPVEER